MKGGIPTLPETERRKHHRSKDVVIITIEGKQHETKNLSESGAMFYSTETYEKNRSYDVVINMKNIDVKAKVHIAHITPHSNNVRYGIEFLYDKGNERKLVQRFINTRGYSEGEEKQAFHWKGPQKHFSGTRKPK